MIAVSPLVLFLVLGLAAGQEGARTPTTVLCVDDEGRPVVGAAVQLFVMTHDESRSFAVPCGETVTDEKGEASFNLAALARSLRRGSTKRPTWRSSRSGRARGATSGRRLTFGGWSSTG